jgi:hypothetical protein
LAPAPRFALPRISPPAAQRCWALVCSRAQCAGRREHRVTAGDWARRAMEYSSPSRRQKSGPVSNPAGLAADRRKAVLDPGRPGVPGAPRGRRLGRGAPAGPAVCSTDAYVPPQALRRCADVPPPAPDQDATRSGGGSPQAYEATFTSPGGGSAAHSLLSRVPMPRRRASLTGRGQMPPRCRPLAEPHIRALPSPRALAEHQVSAGRPPSHRPKSPPHATSLHASQTSGTELRARG